jgi:hypothetical protein
MPLIWKRSGDLAGAIVPPVLASLGYLLLGAPAVTEGPFPPPRILGCFLIFAFWLLSVGSWGKLLQLRSKIGADPALSLALGLALASVFVSTLGMVDLIGFRLRPFYLLLLAVGPVLAPPTFSLSAFPRLPAWLLVFAGIVLAGLSMAALRLGSHWDPLWYHLEATRIWVEQGRIRFLPDEALAFQAGAWDQLYLWAHILLGAPEGRGLVSAQLFAQWTHFTAFLLSGFFLERLLRFFCRSRNWRLLAVVAGMTAEPLLYSSVIAKNDWGAICWLLAAVVLFLEAGQANLLWIAGGLFGLALSTKWTVAFSALPVLASAFLLQRDARKIRIFLLSMLVGLLPICLRNLLGTGDPFYPLFPWIFHEHLPASWYTLIASYRLPRQDIGFFREMHNVIFFLPCILLPIAWKDRRVLTLFLLVSCSFALWRLGCGESGLIRWWSLGLVLAAGALPAAAPVLLAQLRLSAYERSAFLLMLGLCVYSVVNFFPSGLYTTNPLAFSPEFQVRSFPGGASGAWIRRFRPGAKVAVLAGSRLYYLNPVPHVRIWDSLNLDPALSNARNGIDLVQALDRQGFTLLLDEREFIDHYQNAVLNHEVVALIKQHPDTILFLQNNDSRVVDLRALVKASAP